MKLGIYKKEIVGYHRWGRVKSGGALGRPAACAGSVQLSASPLVHLICLLPRRLHCRRYSGTWNRADDGSDPDPAHQGALEEKKP